MPVTAPVGYEANASAAVVTCLASCAAYQTALGAGSVAAARSFIVEDATGPDRFTACDGSVISLAGIYATVRLGDSQRVQRAVDTYGWNGSARIELWIPVIDSDDASRWRTARNLQGQVADQLMAQAASGATFGFIAPTTEAVTWCDVTGSRRGFFVAPINLELRDIP